MINVEGALNHQLHKAMVQWTTAAVPTGQCKYPSFQYVTDVNRNGLITSITL